MNSSKARIKLFGAERFVPRVPQGAEVLGVIERRMQIGALVRQADGGYWQVNGDIALQLNRSMVERALRGARPAGGQLRSGQAARAQKPAPVVTVRRRRTLAPTDVLP